MLGGRGSERYGWSAGVPECGENGDAHWRRCGFLESEVHFALLAQLFEIR